MLNIFSDNKEEVSAKEQQQELQGKIDELRTRLEEVGEAIEQQEARKATSYVEGRTDIAEQASQKLSELYDERNTLKYSLGLLEDQKEKLKNDVIQEQIDQLEQEKADLEDQNSKDSKQAEKYISQGYNLRRKCETRSSKIHRLREQINNLAQKIENNAG